MARSYSYLYQLPTTGLRFFTVYGPWGRPDMALFKFTKNILDEKPIDVFNYGNHKRDFTYVDDAADGIVAAALSDNTENKTYNITKSHSVTLLKAAQMALELVGGGLLGVCPKDSDYPSRGSLNIDAARQDFGFSPKTDVAEGFKISHEWLKNSEYYAKDNR